MKRVILPVLLAATALPTSALVIVTSSQTPYSTAPADDPGFANVGSRGASGVYLGIINGAPWVLTAAHVGAGPITLAGVTYNPVPGSAVTLQNPDNSFADLLKFQLTTAPPLPNLKISSSPAPVGSSVMMIGMGVTGANSPTTYYVNTGTWSWSTDPGAPHDAIAGGYAYSGGGKRWGMNTIDSREVIGPPDYGYKITALVTDFDNVAGEAQAGGGDSGSAMFYKRGSEWELTGINVAIGTYPNQPAAAVFGSITVAVDIAPYYAQIVPEPSVRATSIITVLLGGLGWWIRRRRLARS